MLVLALGISVASAQLFGVSMALGAFLAGMVVGRSEFSVRAASEALPMRDAFAVLFFVSVGMLLDPRLRDRTRRCSSSGAGGRPASASRSSRWRSCSLWGYPAGVALSVAVALAQIGEFSFIVAAVGAQLGLVTDDVRNTLIAAAIVSIAVNPLLYRAVAPLERWMPAATASAGRVAGGGRATEHARSTATRGIARSSSATAPSGGPWRACCARTTSRPTIVDLNVETVRALATRAFRPSTGTPDTATRW